MQMGIRLMVLMKYLVEQTAEYLVSIAQQFLN